MIERYSHTPKNFISKQRHGWPNNSVYPPYSYSHVRNRRYSMDGGPDDDYFINAKAWNFRARDGTDDWAEMQNTA